jgi:hypothetical protein
MGDSMRLLSNWIDAPAEAILIPRQGNVEPTQVFLSVRQRLTR